MARRTAETPKIVFPVPLPKLFAALVEWDGPFTTDEVSGEFNTSDEFTTPALGQLWDAELIDNNDGQWTVAVSVTPESAEAAAREALYGAITVEEPPAKPATPAQRLKARKAAVQPAVTPILDNEGTPITAPETGGRQLDANKGERVLSEGEIGAVLNTTRQSESEKTMTEITGSWINEGEPTHFVDYVEGEEITGHTLLPVPEFIASPPPGVNPNVWELYKTGATMPARIYWGGKVAEQMAAYAEALKAQEAAKAAEVPAPVIHRPAPIDPVTGKPFDFSDVPF